jgi:two-component sensor histidine kinase
MAIVMVAHPLAMDENCNDAPDVSAAVVALFKIMDTAPDIWLTVILEIFVPAAIPVQEAIQNVIKHANAKACRIEITKVGNKELLITIEDNGIGFDSNKKDNTGIGLKNMTDRAKILSSKLKVNSDLGIGTKIEVTFKI